MTLSPLLSRIAIHASLYYSHDVIAKNDFRHLQTSWMTCPNFKIWDELRS